jgi:5-methylthioribose kinase
VKGIWANHDLQREIAKLKYSFMTDAQALLHGDLHTGSIMVTEQSTKVIDPEFAYYGPMGFDIGAVIANLLLNYAAQEGLKQDGEERESYRAYLLDTVVKVWTTFEEEFRKLFKENVKDPVFSAPGFIDNVLAGLLKETSGFAGCKMMRRVIGLAGVADLNSIQDEKIRAKAEVLALAIGQSLVMERQAVASIEDVLSIVKKMEE